MIPGPFLLPKTEVISSMAMTYGATSAYTKDKVELLGFFSMLLLVTVLALWAYGKLRKDIPDVL